LLSVWFHSKSLQLVRVSLTRNIKRSPTSVSTSARSLLPEVFQRASTIRSLGLRDRPLPFLRALSIGTICDTELSQRRSTVRSSPPIIVVGMRPKVRGDLAHLSLIMCRFQFPDRGYPRPADGAPVANNAASGMTGISAPPIMLGLLTIRHDAHTTSKHCDATSQTP
jgi:hypothetical protein